jgi:hypothetical protein
MTKLYNGNADAVTHVDVERLVICCAVTTVSIETRIRERTNVEG